ncbi:hypothetical protein DXG01_015985 [Tephrocybe rancida]|nr:hypothetical protein DXG01_015985 [Tephrocybe rancida]
MSCDFCGRFFVYCCRDGSWIERVCHHYRLAFTGGSCLSNGKAGAKAGLGIVIGNGEEGIQQWAIPVEADVDPNRRRTSQRAELLAAIEGLKRLDDAEEGTEEPRRKHSKDPNDKSEWVIATDSEYVVKGMTECYPTWKARGWKKSNGRVSVNLDLFRKLDSLVCSVEERGINVAFWHVLHKFNTLATSLAKKAAKDVPNN